MHEELDWLEPRWNVNVRHGSGRFRSALRSRSLRAVQLALAAVVGVTSCKGEPPPDQRHGAVRRADRVKIVPWIEVNTLESKAIDDAASGLLIWRNVTDTAIVSTVPGCADLYSQLRKKVPGMHIIPGIKTNACLKAFDSVPGWRIVADQVRAVCEAAGERRVVLENESALKEYWRGSLDIDLDRLRDGLGRLPQGIEIIWYPSMVGESSEVQQRAERLCRVAAEVLDVRFTDLSINGPRSVSYRWSKRGKRRLEKLARKATIPILYFYGPGSRWWQDDQLFQPLELAGEGWVIIYPGVKRWRRAADSISKILAERNPRPSPPKTR